MRAEILLAAALSAGPVLVAVPAEAAELRPLEVAVRSAPPASPLPAVLRREVRAFGPSSPQMREPPVQPDGSPTLLTEQSIGCLVLGTGVAGLTLIAGAENLVNVVGGGLVRAANPHVLALGVLGVTFSTFCAVGGALTPLYLHLVREPAPQAPAPPPAAEPPAHMAVPHGLRQRG